MNESTAAAAAVVEFSLPEIIKKKKKRDWNLIKIDKALSDSE